jgi:hypothetical protein
MASSLVEPVDEGGAWAAIALRCGMRGDGTREGVERRVFWTEGEDEVGWATEIGSASKVPSAPLDFSPGCPEFPADHSRSPGLARV